MKPLMQTPAPTTLPVNSPNTQNNLICSMLGCAALASNWLAEHNITIASITLHGKPVIHVVPSAELSALTHTGGWKMFSYKDPVSGKHLNQYFIELRGCMVTWTTYSQLPITDKTEANHVTH